MNPVVRRIFKWVFILGLLSAAGFWALAAAGGNGETHRQIITDYLNEATGLQANIDQLHSLAFFPDVIIDFEGLAMRDDQGDVVASLGASYMASKFRDVAFRNGKIKSIVIEDFNALPGVLMEEAVLVKQLKIEHESDVEAVLAGEGYIGEQGFTMRVPITVYGAGDDVSYRFDGQNPFIVVMDDGGRYRIVYENRKIVLNPEL